jgi:hypothetical protein
MEDKVYRIWSVLSSFEESSAACISDMLLHVSNGAYVDGVFVAEKFIWHVEILFESADTLDGQLFNVGAKGMYFITCLAFLPYNSAPLEQGLGDTYL